MNCELISVGTEILLGDILNTNVQYLSKALASLGIGVTHHSTQPLKDVILLFSQAVSVLLPMT